MHHHRSMLLLPNQRAELSCRGGSAPLFSPPFTLIFRLFQNFGKKSLFSAYFRLFSIFIQICTKNLRDLCFFPGDFPIFPHWKSCPGLVFFFGFIFFTHPENKFLKIFEFVQMFLQKGFRGSKNLQGLVHLLHERNCSLSL